MMTVSALSFINVKMELIESLAMVALRIHHSAKPDAQVVEDTETMTLTAQAQMDMVAPATVDMEDTEAPVVDLANKSLSGVTMVQLKPASKELKVAQTEDLFATRLTMDTTTETMAMETMATMAITTETTETTAMETMETMATTDIATMATTATEAAMEETGNANKVLSMIQLFANV